MKRIVTRAGLVESEQRTGFRTRFGGEPSGLPVVAGHVLMRAVNPPPQGDSASATADRPYPSRDIHVARCQPLVPLARYAGKANSRNGSDQACRW